MTNLDGPRRRGPAALACLVLLAVASVPALAQEPRDRLDRIERKQDKIDRRQQDLSGRAGSLSSQIQVLDDERRVAESKVEELDRRLSELDADIDVKERELTAAQHELSALAVDLKLIEERLSARRGVYEDRAVAAYKAGPTAAIDGLLSAESFSDLVDRYAYYESALDADSQLIEEIQLLEDETKSKQAEVEDKKNVIASAKLRLERNRASVASLRGERADALAVKNAAVATKQDLLGSVEAKREELEKVEAQLAQESNEIEALLARQAAEAAAAAAAEAAAAAQDAESTRPPPTGSFDSPPSDAGGQLMWPASGSLTSGFGYRVHPIFGYSKLHTGIDIAAAYGSSVWAAGDGSIAYVGTMSGYGNVVVIDHGGGLATTYNHLSASYVSNGQSVARGTRIGAVGCTGYCTGPHLHFEVRVNGSPVDPLPYLQ